MRKVYRLWMLLMPLPLIGCGTAPVRSVPMIAAIVPATPVLPPSTAAGRYHRVERKETLWSISRRYGVDLDTLLRANHVARSSAINTGQVLVIPADGSTAPGAPFQPDNHEFIWPVKGALLASFGARHHGVANQGIDVAAPAGTPVVASRGGRVAFVGDEVPGYGKTIIIDHGDGYHSVYAWNGEVLVTAGQVVPQRQLIAKVGATGRATAPSLHFEIRRGHRPQNPFYFLP